MNKQYVEILPPIEGSFVSKTIYITDPKDNYLPLSKRRLVMTIDFKANIKDIDRTKLLEVIVNYRDK